MSEIRDKDRNWADDVEIVSSFFDLGEKAGFYDASFFYLMTTEVHAQQLMMIVRLQARFREFCKNLKIKL